MFKFFVIASILLLCLNCLVFAQITPKIEEDSRKKAEQLWELAVEAKGGRDRLKAVCNMVISSEAEFYKGFRKSHIRLENLYIFPDKEWIWDDQRPNIFGLSMTMYNWETNKEYSVQFNGEPFKGLLTIESNDKNTNFSGLIIELLETKWNQPKPEKIFSGKVGREKVDVVQTRLLNEKMDFFLDKNTHLPLQIISYSGGKEANVVKISDYIDVGGIKMPSIIVFKSLDGDVKYKRKYQFNVEYNQDILSVPPSFEGGPEAWKKS